MSDIYKRGCFMVTCTGRTHPLTGYPVGYNENAPRIEEIAHALAQINRFTGHACRPYSVAEHSILVWRLVKHAGMGAHAQMAALLHDAHEAYVGDMTSPAKLAVGDAWHSFEREHQNMVQRTFCIRGAAVSYGKAIKHADLVALATERLALLPARDSTATPWPVIDTPGAEITPTTGFTVRTDLDLPWTYWRDYFLAVFQTLDHQRAGNVGGTSSIPELGVAA